MRDYASIIRDGIDSDSGEHGTQDAAHAALAALETQLAEAKQPETLDRSAVRTIRRRSLAP